MAAAYAAPHPPRRAAKEVLQRLRPEEPFILTCLSGCYVEDGPVRVLEAIHAAVTAARRQRSPYFEAYASYSLVAAAAAHLQDAPPGTRLDAAWARPSAILECLRRAEEARRSCKGVLPTHWVAELTAAKAAAHALLPWLERCRRQGDRLPVGASPEVPMLPQCGSWRCSGCGERSSQLRACPCKEARYCRRAGRECHCVCVRASVVRQCGWLGVVFALPRSKPWYGPGFGARRAKAAAPSPLLHTPRSLPQPFAAPPARRPTGRSTSRPAARRARAASRSGGRPVRRRQVLPSRPAAAAAAARPGARALAPWRAAAERVQACRVVAALFACGQLRLECALVRQPPGLGGSTSGQHGKPCTIWPAARTVQGRPARAPSPCAQGPASAHQRAFGQRAEAVGGRRSEACALRTAPAPAQCKLARPTPRPYVDAVVALRSIAYSPSVRQVLARSARPSRDSWLAATNSTVTLGDMSFLEDQFATACAVAEVRGAAACARRSPLSEPARFAEAPRHRQRVWAAWVPRERIAPCPLSAAARRAPRTCSRNQAERSPEAAAFIEMYELAAEAKAFRDRNMSCPAGADGSEWERFWTGCFLRLARCHLAAPAGLLNSPAGAQGLEGEAMSQVLGMCRSSYGDGFLRGGARAVSGALGRLVSDSGSDLRVLARLAVADQPHTDAAACLCGSVLAALSRPGVRASVQAQLAAAQAGEPPTRRLAFEHVELLFCKAAIHEPDDPPTAAGLDARRCGGNRGRRSLAACISNSRSVYVCLAPCVPAVGQRCVRSAHALPCVGTSSPLSRRAATQVLRRLRPGAPSPLLGLFGCLLAAGNPAGALEAVRDAVTAARRQRSPWFEAYASYMLAISAAQFMAVAPAGTQLDAAWARPSAILECLRRAEEARRRCKGVLPTEWMAQLAAAKAPAHALRPWLERCQRRGDRLPAGASPEMPGVPGDIATRCSGCNEPSSHLRACPCKLARYCRRAGRECHCVCARALHAYVRHMCAHARCACVARLRSHLNIGLSHWLRLGSKAGRHNPQPRSPPPPTAAPPARRPTGRSTSRPAARRARVASRSGKRRPGRRRRGLLCRAAAAAAAARLGARALAPRPRAASERVQACRVVAALFACGQLRLECALVSNHLRAWVAALWANMASRI
jgi:hypothetical protein